MSLWMFYVTAHRRSHFCFELARKRKLPLRIMDRFFASKKTSSSSAVQPDRTASTSTGSAAQPATQLLTIADVKCWLSSLPGRAANANVQRIMTAVAVLAKKPHPKRDDVKPLLPSWSVQRFIKKKDRPFADIISDLTKEVIDASNELKVSLAQEPPVATDSAVELAADVSDVEPSATEAAGFGHTQLPSTI